MLITSTKNELIKSIKKQILDKQVVCLDNPKIIYEAFSYGVEFLYVFKKEDYALRQSFDCQTITLSDNVFDSLASTKTSQGLLAIVKINSHSLKPPQGDFLVLDTIQDPGNVGTLIRSARGSNFLDIYLLDSAKLNNDKVIRSSMGAVFKTRCYELSKEEFVSNFAKWNKSLYTCDMSGDSIYSIRFETNIGIVVGNEGQGVSKQIQDLCTKSLSIPMQNDLESLNAGVSGSIIMYQIANAKIN